MELAAHDHSDTRLSCKDCTAPICPKCLVQCAVGFRCRKCADKFTSHVVKVTPSILIRTAIASLPIGYGFGSLETRLLSFSYTIIVWALLYLGGMVIGKVLHRVAAHKLGPSVVATVLAALLIGILLSPLRDTIWDIVIAMSAPVESGDESPVNSYISLIVSHLFSICLFVGGVLTPFLRRI